MPRHAAAYLLLGTRASDTAQESLSEFEAGATPDRDREFPAADE